MVRPRRAETFRRPGKKLDHTSWQLSSGVTSGLAAGTVAFNFSSVGVSPATLLRIRGNITGWADAASTPGFAVHVNYGIILVPEGSATTPQFTPVADANAPWLLYGTALLGYEEQVNDVVDTPGITSFQHMIDNKAMRIIRPDLEMQLVVENTTAIVGDAINFSYQLRWLQGF